MIKRRTRARYLVHVSRARVTVQGLTNALGSDFFGRARENRSFPGRNFGDAPVDRSPKIAVRACSSVFFCGTHERQRRPDGVPLFDRAFLPVEG